MQKHFVTFLSPGTLFAEATTKEIDNWDPQAALAMSKEIVERYGSTPYAFYFTTRVRGDDDFDSKESALSCMYFIKGRVLTIEDVQSRGEDFKILAMNMISNDTPKMFENANGYAWHQPFGDNDIILEVVE